MAQKSDSSDDISAYLEGAVPEVDGKVTFTKEFSIPGLSKDVVYERVNKWMEKRLAQNENDRSRVVYSNAQSGILAGAAEEWLVFKSNALALDRAWMGYAIKAECSDNACKVVIDKIRYTYQEKEKYTAEETITDKVALNKAKTKMVIGFKKWRVKTVDFADDIFDGVALALGTDEAKEAELAAAAAEKAAQKKHKKTTVVINTGANATTAETVKESVAEAQPVVAQAQAEPTAVSKAEATAQPQTQDALREVAPEEVSKDAIKLGEGKLVIVIGEGDAFNMTVMTANAGGSIGRVDGKPVVFSILSPDQPYDALEKAETYSVKFYPTEAASPSVVLQCRKVAAPAPFEGQPRTYIGEIVSAMTK
jgi:hypothetical protein